MINHCVSQSGAHPVIGLASTLTNYDAFLFGIPTRYGIWPSQWKTFLDSTGQLWQTGGYHGKMAGVFISTASQHGVCPSFLLFFRYSVLSLFCSFAILFFRYSVLSLFCSFTIFFRYSVFHYSVLSLSSFAMLFLLVFFFSGLLFLFFFSFLLFLLFFCSSLLCSSLLLLFSS
jgi:hypothetical protein